MSEKKFTYSIKHPEGVNIVFFMINQVKHDRYTLLQNTDITAEGITIEGTMSMPIFGATINILIQAVGEPNYLITYNIKYKNKPIFDKDVEVRIEHDRRTNHPQLNIEYDKP
jgi:hypothetical protein